MKATGVGDCHDVVASLRRAQRSIYAGQANASAFPSRLALKDELLLETGSDVIGERLAAPGELLPRHGVGDAEGGEEIVRVHHRLQHRIVGASRQLHPL